MHPSRLLLAGLVVTLGLGACSDPEPKLADPSPSATTSEPTSSAATVGPTPTTSAVEPRSPSETVRLWVNAWNAAVATGDTSGMRTYVVPDCRNCDSVFGLVEDIYSAGGYIEGGTWTPVSVKKIDEQDGEVVVALAVDVAAGRTVFSAGAEAVDFPASKS